MKPTQTTFAVTVPITSIACRAASGQIFFRLELMARELHKARIDGRNVYICGNGGSAANAVHMANDFHFGIGACGPGLALPGLCVEALSANTAIISCLANDIGYQNIFAHQLKVKARPNDILIVLSGSGNSQNIIRALEVSAQMNMTSFAILGFDGGKSLALADFPIHFQIDDMQIAEDTQLIVGHLCMQWLQSDKPSTIEPLGELHI